MEFPVELLNEIPNGAYIAVVGGLVASLFLQGLKKWLDLQSDKVITLVLISMSFIISAIDYLMQAVAVSPMALGQDTATIVGIATAFYRFIIKPANNLVVDAKTLRQSKVTTPEQPQENVLSEPEMNALAGPQPTAEEVAFELKETPEQPQAVTPVSPSNFS